MKEMLVGQMDDTTKHKSKQRQLQMEKDEED